MMSERAVPRRAAWTQPLRKALAEPLFLTAMLREYGTTRFPILTYHSVSDEPGFDIETVTPVDFERQMCWLATRGFRVVTVSDIARAMTRGERRILSITFDDGYRDNVLTALPILRKHGFKASFYIATAYIGGLSLWVPEQYFRRRPMLTTTEIQMLSDADHEIGSHTHTHRDLTRVEPPVLDEEIERSRGILGGIIRKPVVSIAAPYGRSSEGVAARVARSGYTTLVTGGRFTANLGDTSPFDLKRITIARADSLREFAKKVSGAYQWLSFRDR